MKHNLLSLFIVASVAMNMYATDVWDGSSDIFTHGSGTEASPYLIENAEQLAFIAELVNAGVTTYSGNYFKLTTDLDLNNISWTPIGTETSQFGGNFDGNNHSITNLNVTSATNAGLFGVVGGGTYKKLTIQGTIPASANATNAGGLVGSAYTTISIEHILCDVTITGTTNAGGLVGNAIYVSMSDCKNEANITAQYAGGLIGHCAKANIRNSVNTGNVSSGRAAAGIISATDTASITNVGNFGTITVTSYSSQWRTRNYTSSYGSEINGRYYRNHVEDWSISLYGYCGGIVSQCGYIEMNMCTNYGDVRLSANINSSILINNNTTEGTYNYKKAFTDNKYNYTLTFTNPCGGLVGLLGEGFIRNSGNIGNLSNNINVPSDPSCSSITKNYIMGCAGICGVIQGDKSCDIFKCSNVGDIIRGYYSGGVVGNKMSSVTVTINSCFSTGSISGTINGGIAAQASNLQIKNCYSTGQTSMGIGAGTVTNSYYINGSGNGTQKTDAQMKSASMPILLNADSVVFRQDVKPYVNKGYPIFQNGMRYVATNGATDVSYTTASLHGNYYNCVPDSMGFEFKEESAENYISQIVSNASPAQFELTNLTQGTTYVARYWLIDDGIKFYGDTIHFTTLACPAQPVSSDTVAICEGESYEFAGQTLTLAGVYHDSLVATTGCDSVIELVLQVTDTYKYPRTETINRGESYDFYGQLLTEPGVYNEYIRTTNRCNWIELTLIVHEPDKTLTINVNNPQWGSVVGAGTYEHGTVAELSAIPAEGCYFVNWSDGETNPTRVIALTKDTTVTANFAIHQYTITTQANNGTVTGAGTYNYGTQVNLTAIAKEHYHFVRWNDGDTTITRQITVVEDKTYTALFEKDKFLILFLNDDGTELKSDSVEYGAIPIAPANPTKTATAQYTYTFNSWSPTVVSVAGNATYTATYNSVVNKYVVMFLNEDSTLLQIDTLNYGTLPEYRGSTPTKSATAQYTYTFAGWDAAIVDVTGNATYRATYTSIVNKYVVTFQDWDGTFLQRDTLVYGTIPVYSGITPTKAATAQYTYTFNGWNPAVVSVNGNATYTATYASVVNKYVVMFLNEDSTLLQMDTLAFGSLPVYRGTTPTKASTAQYSYTFAGWDAAIVDVTGNATYRATYTSAVNKYVVVFQDEDGILLQRDTLEYGAMPIYRGAAPTKAATAQYTFTFNGWNPTVVSVTGDATYEATYTSVVNKYVVMFCDEDSTLLQIDTLVYGTLPEYRGTTPTKSATVQYTYTFGGWTPSTVSFTENAVYYATYTFIVNKYVVVFQNEDGTPLQRDSLEYGAMPVYRGVTPTKDATAQYTYMFSGWNPIVVTVTGDATYEATYTSTVNKYVVTFLNEDSTLLQIDTLNYGTLPEYRGSTPTKSATAQYTYTFAGWDAAIVDVTGNATYKATYTSSFNKYVVTFQDEGGALLQRDTLEYGAMPVYRGATPTKEATAQYTYTFNGWNPTVVSVTGDATYEATYTSVVNKYVVMFQDEDGTLLQRDSLEYGTLPVYRGVTPTKEATAEHTYSFNGWSPAIVSVVGNATYVATYSEIVNKYVVLFLNEDNTLLQVDTLEYGTLPVYRGQTPVKESTAQYSYEFVGWSPVIVSVTGNASYVATYTSIINKYLVTFLDSDSTLIEAKEWEYGTMPTCTEPTKEPDELYTYTFIGWNPTVVAVVAEATYVATYEATLINSLDGIPETKQQPIKVMVDGKMYILMPDGTKYSATGKKVE